MEPIKICRHKKCRHYSEIFSEKEIKDLKCNQCHYAYINKEPNLIERFLNYERLVDKFITHNDYKSMIHNRIELSLFSGLMISSGIALFLMIVIIISMI